METKFQNTNITTNDDLIHRLSFESYNGKDFSVSAAIDVKVDPDGYIDENIRPGQINFLTAGDDGLLRKRVEIDKNGRLMSYHESWCIGTTPGGSPLKIFSNFGLDHSGCSISLNASRGTFLQPRSLKKDDVVFKISFKGYNRGNYRETSAIESKIVEIDETAISSRLIFKTSDSQGSIKNILEVDDRKVQFHRPLEIFKVSDKHERDSIVDPNLGTLIYVESIDQFQGFTKSGWVDLNKPAG